MNNWSEIRKSNIEYVNITLRGFIKGHNWDDCVHLMVDGYNNCISVSYHRTFIDLDNITNYTFEHNKKFFVSFDSYDDSMEAIVAVYKFIRHSEEVHKRIMIEEVK